MTLNAFFSLSTITSLGESLPFTYFLKKLFIKNAGICFIPYVLVIGEDICDSLLEGASGLRTSSQLGVNANGERFANELPASYTALTYDMIMDGNAPFYYIFDSSDESRLSALEAGIELGEVVKGNTIEALAEAMGADASVLSATLERYNAFAGAGVDEDFHKPVENLVALTQEPFYGVKFYPTTFGSTGGVLTDDQGRVQRQDGSVIEGLYAAGEMSNRYYYNHNYVLTASLGLYSTMGLRAGDAAVTDQQ